MLRKFRHFSKGTSKSKAPAPANKRAKGIPAESPPDAPFVAKNPSCLDVLIRTGVGQRYHDTEPLVLQAFKDDCGEDKAAIVSKRIHYEIDARTLRLPGFRLMTMNPIIRMSRMRNLKADEWRREAHEKADCFAYHVDVENAEAYLNGPPGTQRPGWERDRRLLREPRVMESPKKPLLLLVSSHDDDLDVERISNLLGLGGNTLGRPFRCLAHATTSQGGADLKEALEWLTAMSRGKDDEDTAVTECETEEESSVVTSTSTLTSVCGGGGGGGHYVLDYEPTLLGGNPILQRFEPIKKGTYCPFARAAKLWGGKLPDEHTPRLANRVDQIEEVATLNGPPLAEFVARSNNGEPLDGFLLEIPGASWCSVEVLGQTVRSLLTKLAELDPSPGENAMEMGPIDHPHWRFRFGGEDFFLTTFSPVYKEDSSRYAFKARAAFLLFQPLASFGRHGLTQDTPASATKWDNPTTMRDKARVAFKKNGCPYHIPETLPYPVAEHVVKPLKDDGINCVRWWLPLEESRKSG